MDNRMELAMPPKVTAEMVKGFIRYMLKAVMNERGRRDDWVCPLEPPAIMPGLMR